MRKIICLAMVFFLAMAPLAANAAEDFTVRGKFQFDTRHIGDYTGALLTNAPVATVDLGVINNLAGLFLNAEVVSAFWLDIDAIRKVEADFGWEYDFNGWGVKLVTGYFSLPKIGKTKDDLFGFWVEVSTPDIFLGQVKMKPGVAFERDFPVVAGNMGGGGAYWKYWSAFSLKDRENYLTIVLTAGGNDGPFGTKVDLLSFGRLTLSSKKVPILEKFGIVAELNLQKGFGHSPENGGLAGDGVWFSLKRSF